MKKIWLVTAIILSAVLAKAQLEIKIGDLNKHIGDSVTVCTKIYGGIFLDRSNGTPTLLNAGGLYPNAPLTIMIGAEARKLFKYPPEIFYKNKEVCITGKLILYKDKPEIIIFEEKQIIIKEGP